jgi:hypothetical protein
MRPCVEPLDDRVVPSGVTAFGNHAMTAAAAHVAAHPNQGVVAQFDATINHIEQQAVTQFDRASRRIDHFETMERGAVDRAAARFNEGTISSARASAIQPAGSINAIARDLGRFVTHSELRWNQTARAIDNRFDRAVRRDVRNDPALEPTALAAESDLKIMTAELGNRLAGHLAAASNDLQSAMSSAQATAAVVRARTATARPSVAVPAAPGRVHHAPAVHPTPSARAALTSVATGTATAAPFLAAGLTTGIQSGTSGSLLNGAGLGPVPATVGPLAPGGIPGSVANGAFGVGTIGGIGDLIGGTPPSPVTGTTGAGVDSGLDTLGIGNGLGVGTGIDMTPNGVGLFF